MTDKNKISVDHPQQHIENNIGWQDYPCINTETGKKLKHTLGYYFESWEDYLKNGNDTNYETKQYPQAQARLYGGLFFIPDLPGYGHHSPG